MAPRIVKKLLVDLGAAVTPANTSLLISALDQVPTTLDLNVVEQSIGKITYYILTLLLSEPSAKHVIPASGQLPQRIEELRLRNSLETFWITVRQYRGQVYRRLLNEGFDFEDYELIPEQIQTAEGLGWIDHKREKVSIERRKLNGRGVTRIIPVQEIRTRYFPIPLALAELSSEAFANLSSNIGEMESGNLLCPPAPFGDKSKHAERWRAACEMSRQGNGWFKNKGLKDKVNDKNRYIIRDWLAALSRGKNAALEKQGKGRTTEYRVREIPSPV